MITLRLYQMYRHAGWSRIAALAHAYEVARRP